MIVKEKNRFIILGGLLAVFLMLVCFVGIIMYKRVYEPQFQIDKASCLYIDTDDNADSVRCKIQETFHPKSLVGFDFLVDVLEYDTDIQTGCYQFEPNDNMRTVVRRLKAGWQTPVRLVVPSVRTVDKMVEALSRQIMVSKEEIWEVLNDEKFLSRIDYTNETLPALFLPNTYEVYWNTTAKNLIERFQRENEKYWSQDRLNKATALGLSQKEVSTLASIIDEETANDAEKPIVAGLYLNRLKRGMLLQADPTVKFALQDFTLRRILNVHLETDSPYNTYKYAGLPPGPIRIPSLVAIESVLNPQKHDYIYMCAKEDFSGTHNFASTLSQHNVNARRYQQALNKMGIK